MIGQLPMRYEIALWIVGFLACVAAGAWLAFSTPVPLMWHYGAVAGAVLGPLLVRAYCRSLTAQDTGTPQG